MFEQKEKLLKQKLKELGSVAVAFSGGVDSTFLLYMAKKVLGDNVLAITLDATATPRRDLDEVVDFLKEESIKYEIIKFDQLSIEGFKENGEDRCYLCKKAMFEKVKEVAKEHGIDNVIEGSNKDDLKLTRPGMRALDELGITSPLMEVGIGKYEIRMRANDYKLKAANKPSNSCLATRIETNEIITEEKLGMIEEAENYLKDSGYNQVRVRVHRNNVIIEVEQKDVSKLEKSKESVEQKLQEIGFNTVSIHPYGYLNARKKEEKKKQIDELYNKISKQYFPNNTLYLDCSAGISGDMMVGALLDLGADSQKLFDILMDIPAELKELKMSRVDKAGIDCQDFDVVLVEDNHDHDMEYLYGENEPHHEHENHHHHAHRNLRDVIRIIENTKLNDNAKNIAKEIFTVVAEAESKAHNEPIDKVHFHEVGAVDSIMDIVAVAFCIDDLKIKKVIVPSLSEGKGTVRCAHGVLPVPVPAVKNIVDDYNINLKIMDYEGEFVTPTGAAIVAAIRTSDKLPSNMKILKTGYGAGKREHKLPSILRAMIIEKVEESD